MEYKIKEKPKSEKEIEVSLTVAEIEKELVDVGQELSTEMKFDGFRSGKVPLEIIQEKVGPNFLWERAAQLALQRAVLTISQKEGIDIIPPIKTDIVKIESGQPLTCNVSVVFLPQIILSDYREKVKGIFEEKKEIKIEPAEVEKALNNLQKSRAKIVRVLREAQDSDLVLFNFQGRIDGVPQEGLRGDKTEIILGEKRFIREFEKEIIGAKEGEKKKFSLRMPTSEGVKKEVEFEVEILAVNQREIPLANDDFARSLGNFSDLKELVQKLEKNIRSEKENSERDLTRTKALELIIKNLSVEIPDILIERESQKMLNEFKSYFGEEKFFNEYLTQNQKDETKLKEEWKEEAKKRILISLTLRAIAKREGIKASDEEIKEHWNQLNDEVKRKTDEKQLRNYLEEVIQNKKVMEKLESFN